MFILRKTWLTLNHLSLLKTSLRNNSLYHKNGSFGRIFYILKFSGQRFDFKKEATLNCQLAGNTDISSTELFIKCYSRSVTQIHKDVPLHWSRMAQLKDHNQGSSFCHLLLRLSWRLGGKVTGQYTEAVPQQTTVFHELLMENSNSNKNLHLLHTFPAG